MRRNGRNGEHGFRADYLEYNRATINAVEYGSGERQIELDGGNLANGSSESIYSVWEHRGQTSGREDGTKVYMTLVRPRAV